MGSTRGNGRAPAHGEDGLVHCALVAAGGVSVLVDNSVGKTALNTASCCLLYNTNTRSWRPLHANSYASRI